MSNLPQTPLFAFLNPTDGSRWIVNVQPSNTNNTHRPNFPNNVKLKIDWNVDIPVSSNHFAELIRSANLSIGPLHFIRVDDVSNVKTSGLRTEQNVDIYCKFNVRRY